MKKEMSEILRELRMERGLTQEEVGKVIGVQKAAIQKYEKGDVENMKRSSIQKLSDFYNVSPSYLMGLEEKKDANSEVSEIFKNRPELKILFNLTKDATKEEVEKAVKIIETMLGK